MHSNFWWGFQGFHQKILLFYISTYTNQITSLLRLNFRCWSSIRDLLYKVIFQDPDHRNAVCWAEKYPETKTKTDTLITLINQSQEIRPQGLDLGRSTSIRGQIKTLRPYFSIFSITVVRICLRKQQSKFFTNMLSTPSIEPVNIWFD